MVIDLSPGGAFHFFLPHAHLLQILPSTEGNINQTWIVHFTSANSSKTAVLQRLCPVVFPDPSVVMNNFRIVTRHCASIAVQNRGRGKAMPVVPEAYSNPDGEDCIRDATGGLWRLISYIGPSRTLSTVNGRQAAAVGAMLAHFHQLISTLSAAEIHDPLPGFHDTPQYLRHFDAISARRSPHNIEEEFCFASIEQLRPLAGLLQTNSSSHAQQLVHADPKCSNFLFAQESNTVLSLIDLDTVRFGFLVHDLGDCLRSCCNQSGEEKNTQPIFDQDCFSALLGAYLANGGRALLTKSDQEFLVEAARLLIFELGLRFFTDHLQGNTYFTCRYPAHNLHRAMVQFRLHASLMAQEKQLRQALTALLA